MGSAALDADSASGARALNARAGVTAAWIARKPFAMTSTDDMRGWSVARLYRRRRPSSASGRALAFPTHAGDTPLRKAAMPSAH